MSVDSEQVCSHQKCVCVSAGFPGVNAEFQELVQACAEAALENNDSELQIKVSSQVWYLPSSMRQWLPCLVLHLKGIAGLLTGRLVQASTHSIMSQYIAVYAWNAGFKRT